MKLVPISPLCLVLNIQRIIQSDSSVPMHVSSIFVASDGVWHGVCRLVRDGNKELVTIEPGAFSGIKVKESV